MIAILTTFKGAARRLAAIDYSRAARLIGAGEDEVRAVVQVEAASSGFDALGRPKMLFEPHRFYAELAEPKRSRAVNAGLAYRRWGEKPYPKDSYPRLEQAMVIDKQAALRASSWGLGQIMGANHRMVGYASAEEMVLDLLDDEEAHLTQMMRFVVASGLDDDLREIAARKRASTPEDWAPFARVYNGPGYAKHGYHTKLAAAHAKWRRTPDAG